MSEELIAAAIARMEDLLQPINGGVGEDISYDERFDEIKNQTEKLSSLTGETCNWDKVGATSSELLLEKSKDFRVGCYLATVKLREGKIESVVDGLVLLDELTKRYWDTMFPPVARLRARAGMVGWMSDQSGDVVIDCKLKASDAGLVEAAEKLSANLDASWRDRFADAYTGMSKLRDAIRHLARTVPREQPKPAPLTQTAGAAPPPPAMVAAPAFEATDPDSARKAIENAGTALLRASVVIRASKPEDVLAYRAGMFGAWIVLEETPPSDGGITLVPSPPSSMKERFDTLVASQEWLTLLMEALDTSGEYILWIDPVRYASTAMSALGALFMKAKQELLLQTALLLKRVPMLPKLQFSDGAPFADGPTQMWIEAEVLPVLASGEGGGRGGGGQESALDEPLKEARDLAVKGELGKAIAVVRDAADAAPTPSVRFRGRLAIAQLCLGAGQPAVARSQLEGLAGVIEHHDLESWDPGLCGEVYAALYGATKGVNDAKGADQAGDALSAQDTAAERAAFEKLCRLDPAAALKLARKKAGG